MTAAYLCEASFGLAVCFLGPSELFAFGTDFMTGRPVPLFCELAVFRLATEAILAVDAIVGENVVSSHDDGNVLAASR